MPQPTSIGISAPYIAVAFLPPALPRYSSIPSLYIEETCMDWILPLLGGLGLGSLLKSFLDFRQSRAALTKDRQYQEKREAYLGLLGALHQSAIRPSDEAAKEYALWQTRCELFGSPEVARYARDMASTNEGPREMRYAAFEGLVASMRNDLRQ